MNASENRRSIWSNLCFHGLLVFRSTEPPWKPICCDKAINRSGTTVFLANRFNFPFIQRDSLRCPRWTEAEVDCKQFVRNEITKGILFNDFHRTRENKRCVCRENQIKSPSIPWPRMAATKRPYNTESNSVRYKNISDIRICFVAYC